MKLYQLFKIQSQKRNEKTLKLNTDNIYFKVALYFVIFPGP